MFDGNMFLPETGTPIWKIDRSSTRLAVWLPDPLTVATWMAKSLTMRSVRARGWFPERRRRSLTFFYPAPETHPREPAEEKAMNYRSESLQV